MNTSLIAGRFETDKSQIYLDRYHEMFEALKEKPVALLELGVNRGGSLYLWREYFTQGLIAGLDKNPDLISNMAKGDTERMHVYCGRQEDEALLRKVARECAPNGFDIVIDDASHIADLARRSFWCLFNNHLKKGGLYVIEDWGTGYWNHWPDGKSYDNSNHLAGMTGFVKELIDECAMDDIAKESTVVGRPSKIEYVKIFHGQVFVKKA